MAFGSAFLAATARFAFTRSAIFAAVALSAIADFTIARSTLAVFAVAGFAITATAATIDTRRLLRVGCYDAGYSHQYGCCANHAEFQ